MIGVDLVYIPEFQARLEISSGAILSRAFHESEMQSHRIEHLAGLWAAKEAVTKAAAVTPAKWTDIVISYDGTGRPYARIKTEEFAISISHHGDYAVAVAYRVGS